MLQDVRLFEPSTRKYWAFFNSTSAFAPLPRLCLVYCQSFLASLCIYELMAAQWRQGPTGWRISEGGKLWRTADQQQVFHEFFDTEKAIVDHGLDLVYSVSFYPACPQLFYSNYSYSILLHPLSRLWICLNLYWLLHCSALTFIFSNFSSPRILLFLRPRHYHCNTVSWTHITLVASSTPSFPLPLAVQSTCHGISIHHISY